MPDFSLKVSNTMKTEATKGTYLNDITLRGKRYQVYTNPDETGKPYVLIGPQGEYAELISVVNRPTTFGVMGYRLRTQGPLKGMRQPFALGYVELVDGHIVNPPPITCE